MSTKVPRIGIDRYLDPTWMAMAAEVVRGETKKEDLDDRLALELGGAEVRIKTSGILNRIWFSPDPVCSNLAAAAADHIAVNGDEGKALAFSAVTIAAYPFFGEVMETVGRLLKLQGSCASGEVHRRMFEKHGKRTTISLADARAFRTMVAWGMLVRRKDNRLAPGKVMPAGKSGRALMDRGANLFRGSITPLSNGDPLLFAFR